MALTDSQLRGGLFGNIANNLIAAGRGTQQTSPFQAISTMRRNNLADTLAMRQEDRLARKIQMEQDAADLAAKQLAEKQAILAQQPVFGPMADSYGTGQDTRVQDLSAAGYVDTAAKLKGLDPNYGTETIQFGGEQVTFETIDGQRGKEIARGPKWNPEGGGGVNIEFPDKKDPGSWKRATDLETSLTEDKNALQTIGTLRGVLDRSGSDIIGGSGTIRTTLAPIANMLGVASDKMDDAELVNALFTGQAGSLRSQIIGTGQVSDFEQKRLDTAAGGGIAGLRAVYELLDYYEEKSANKYNRNVSNLSDVVKKYDLAGYGEWEPHTRAEKVSFKQGQTFSAPPPVSQWPSGMKLQKNQATGEYRFTPVGG